MLAAQAFRLWLSLTYLASEFPEGERGRLNKMAARAFREGLNNE